MRSKVLYPLEEGVRIALAIRIEFHPTNYEAIDPKMALSASFGVRCFGQGKSIEATLRRAHEGLYRAKPEGRNRVRRWETRNPTPLQLTEYA